MEQDLSLNLAGIQMKNPVMNASGLFGFGPGYARIENLENLGAILSKTITPKPREGNPQPRIIKIETGIMNSVGLANEGIEKFIEETLPKCLKIGPPIIASIAGDTIEEYGDLVKKLDEASGISGIEVNTSCPNVHGGNIPFGTDPIMIGNLVSTVRKNTKLPLIVKLTPNVEKIEPLAKATEEAGADILSLINTLLGLSIDIKRKKAKFDKVVAGISGPAIKNHALFRVWQVAKVTKLPIIGIGGISSTEDAIEFIMAGATALAVGTANYSNPNIISEITLGIKEYLKKIIIKTLPKLEVLYSFLFYFLDLINGKGIASRTVAESVKNMINLSSPIPFPEIGGIPYSIASIKFLSIRCASSSP